MKYVGIGGTTAFLSFRTYWIVPQFPTHNRISNGPCAELFNLDALSNKISQCPSILMDGWMIAQSILLVKIRDYPSPLVLQTRHLELRKSFLQASWICGVGQHSGCSWQIFSIINMEHLAKYQQTTPSGVYSFFNSQP